jgi:GNAT superfamily N-acetyltransferase
MASRSVSPCQNHFVTETSSGHLRAANTDDSAQLLHLWAQLFDDEGDAAAHGRWSGPAREWFAKFVDDAAKARFPVIEVDGELVATAIGTLELGVPNPQCLQGRTVRLANVITLPDHRGRGYGTRVVRDVINWARGITADRVDLSASLDGQRLYEKLGFIMTSAPRMKLVL